MTEPTEDIDYTVDEFATPDPEPKKGTDVDQPNKSVLKEVSQELANDIATESSFASITLPVNAKPEDKIAAYDEIAIHKGLVLHLQKYQLMIDNKLKELV